MTTAYATGINLSNLVSRYDKLEADRGSNPGEMRNWKNKALRPVTEHRFLLMESRDTDNLSESQVVYILGKDEKPPAEAPYEGITYGTFDIEQRQSIEIPQTHGTEGKSTKEPSLVSRYRIVMKTSDGRRRPLKEIQLQDITEDVVEHSLRDSGYYEREGCNEGYTKIITAEENSVARSAEENELILKYKREKESEIEEALKHAVERIKSYSEDREHNSRRMEELRRTARKEFLYGMAHSEGWTDAEVKAFADEHRARIEQIHTLEDKCNAHADDLYKEVKGTVTDLKLALMGTKAVVEAYGISYALHFGARRYDGNAWIEPDKEATMHIVSTDKRVCDIPLTAIDSITVTIWDGLEASKPKAEKLEHAPRRAVATKKAPTIGYPDIEALVAGIPQEQELELVGAATGSRGF